MASLDEMAALIKQRRKKLTEDDGQATSNSSQPAPGSTDFESPSQEHLPTESEQAELEWKAYEDDKAAVDDELQRYIDDGILKNSTNFDILRFWHVSLRAAFSFVTVMLMCYSKVESHKYPMLFRVALDVLPVQASSVPCECVFSSSKETTTDRRNRIAPQFLEMLQVLKFRFRSKRVSFVEGWASEKDEEVFQTQREQVANPRFGEPTSSGNLNSSVASSSNSLASRFLSNLPTLEDLAVRGEEVNAPIARNFLQLLKQGGDIYDDPELPTNDGALLDNDGGQDNDEFNFSDFDYSF